MPKFDNELLDRIRTNDASLLELNLSDLKIGNEGAKKLAEALKTNKTIYSLSLIDNQISDEGAQYFLKTIMVNRTLTEIEIFLRGHLNVVFQRHGGTYQPVVPPINKDQNHISREVILSLQAFIKRNQGFTEELLSEIQKGNLGKAKELINQGVSIHSIVPHFSRTEYKANINETALEIAARYGQLEIVKWLVGHGALQSKRFGTHHNRPLDLAKRLGHNAVIDYLKKVLPKDEEEILAEQLKEMEIIAKQLNLDETSQEEKHYPVKLPQAQRIAPPHPKLSSPLLPPPLLPPELVPSSLPPPSDLGYLISSKDLQFGQPIDDHGGFGIVYMGYYKSQVVAIKKLKNQNPRREELDDFKKEIAINASLKSNYIVEFKGACLEQSNYVLVMEFMQKGSLYKLLGSDQQIQWSTRVKMIEDIAYGIDYIHARGIAHCDLRSPNVLLDNNFRAKISDFGLSKIRSSNFTFSTIGPQNIYWEAPELVTPPAKPNEASDVYSFALVMWEICSRKTPFLNLPMVQLMGILMTGVGELNEKQKMLNAMEKGAPPSIAQLIAQCWDRRAENRPPIRQVLYLLQNPQHVSPPINEQDVPADKVVAPRRWN